MRISFRNKTIFPVGNCTKTVIVNLIKESMFRTVRGRLFYRKRNGKCGGKKPVMTANLFNSPRRIVDYYKILYLTR